MSIVTVPSELSFRGGDAPQFAAALLSSCARGFATSQDESAVTVVPDLRVRVCKDSAPRRGGEFVLYWMIAFRRSGWNFSLDRAVEWAAQLGKPLIVFEAVRCNYRWASDRLHRFIIDGMAANAAAFAGRVAYYPYVEPSRGAGEGLLAALADRACVVVTDDFPSLFLPGMIERVARRMPCRFEAIDSNGLLPMRACETVQPTAFAFRRFLQKSLPPHLIELPSEDPLARQKLPRLDGPPGDVLDRWPAASASLLRGDGGTLDELPIDHAVRPTTQRGGSASGRVALHTFLNDRLAAYGEQRNEPDIDGASGLSSWLHFGHVSPHEVFAAVAAQEEWSVRRLSTTTKGSREGWWSMSKSAESFLDEFVTWRELGFNMCRLRPDYDRFESLPQWAKDTLDKHARDKRQWLYSVQQFEQAQTHDALWNAAQRQLLGEGRIHNYLRMLWGKKILEWSASPREALDVMVELNNKYALDGRNPNSYTGIFWVLGRYDRPWGPERPIFGTIRYMSSDNTARKMSVKGYLKKWGGSTTLFD